MTFREQNPSKATPRNKQRTCILKWADGSEEAVRFVSNCGEGFAVVERDDLGDDGQRERIEVRLAQLEWR